MCHALPLLLVAPTSVMSIVEYGKCHHTQRYYTCSSAAAAWPLLATALGNTLNTHAIMRVIAIPCYPLAVVCPNAFPRTCSLLVAAAACLQQQLLHHQPRLAAPRRAL